MALVKCKECGNQVSSKAKTCPSCGAKVKSRSFLKKLGYIFIALFVIALIGSLNKGSSSSNTSNPASTTNTAPTKDYSEIRVCAPNAIEEIEKLPNGSITKGIPAKYIYTGPDLSYSVESEGISQDQKMYVLKEQNGWIKFRITENEVGWSAWVPKDKTISLEELRKQREQKWGQVPDQSTLNRSVRCVKDYLKNVANDPDSLKFERWSDVYYNENDGWIVRCEYRGKNTFGAYVRNANWFVIQHGQVVQMAEENKYGGN